MTKLTQDFSTINKTIAQQKIISLYIKKLKNIRELSMDFSNKNLTAILGPNGCGKSTLIHALACCYQPKNKDELKNNEYSSINYKFSDFFLPTTHSTWQGSEFTLIHSCRNQKTEEKELYTKYTKEKRWKPIYKRRPQRYVSFIGIKTCVPKIEEETQKSRIQYSTQVLSDDISHKVKEQASWILNRDYTEYHINTVGAKNKEYIGVKFNTQVYSALSMGAGEQRIFFILKEVFQASKYSLILIDEIDLLLHEDALDKLLKFLKEISEKKRLQIIFTTHSQSIIKHSDWINIRHLSSTPEKTLCFNETKPDAIHRLTGTQERPLEIFVEDDLTKTIVKKLAGELGISKYVSITEYGAAKNCFTLLAGMLLKQTENLEKMLFILDGDIYQQEDEKLKQIKSVLTGSDPKTKERQTHAVKYIRQLTLENGDAPEECLHKLIRELTPEYPNNEYNEIIKVAKDINVSNESHNYINEIINRMDDERAVGLKKVIDVIAQSEKWNDLIKEIKEWLENKKPHVLEN